MIDRLSPLFELKLAGPSLADGEFIGYASTFGGVPDSYGDIVAPGSFSKTLAEHAGNSTMPAMLWSHDPDKPIGKWLSMSEDGHGLKVKGRLTLATQRGAEAHALLKDDALALSIGYRVAGSKYSGSNRVLTEIKLHEASLVALPANAAARVEYVKSAGACPTDIRSLEAMLRDALGFSSREAKRMAGPAWRALERRDDATDESKEIATLLMGAAQLFAKH
jgi:hypothetical protein